MVKKKLLQYKKDYYGMVEEYRIAYSKCINAGIHISPTCIVNKSKWRIVIEFKNKKGDVTEIIESDDREDISKNKVYYSKEEYTIKIMQLYIFYASESS